MKLEISGVKVKLTEKQEKYINKKIRKLEKYLPRRAKGDASHAVVRIKQVRIDKLERIVSEITLKLPRGTLVVQEASERLFTAVDLAATKLKQSIVKHKEKNPDTDAKFRQKLAGRFHRP